MLPTLVSQSSIDVDKSAAGVTVGASGGAAANADAVSSRSSQSAAVSSASPQKNSSSTSSVDNILFGSANSGGGLSDAAAYGTAAPKVDYKHLRNIFNETQTSASLSNGQHNTGANSGSSNSVYSNNVSDSVHGQASGSSLDSTLWG